MRAAFAAKMKRARAAKRGKRTRVKNPKRKRAKVARGKSAPKRRKKSTGKFGVFNGTKRIATASTLSMAKTHAYAYAFHHPRATVAVKKV